MRHLANDKYIVILGVELADKYNENVMTFFFFLTSSARLKKKKGIARGSIISHSPGGA